MRVLKEVVNVLQANLRAEDLFAAGEARTAVVLYADNEQAKLTAEKTKSGDSRTQI